MSPLVRRLPTVDVQPSPGDSRPDYVDGFEVHLDAPDERTAEQWARAALEQAPRAIRWTVLIAHRGVLRFRLEPRSSPDSILGWQILSSRPDEVHLAANGPLLRGLIVGRRPSPNATQIRTFLYFHRRPAAQLIWSLVGPIHRLVAPYLLKRASRGD